MTSRRRIMMAGTKNIPDPAIPEAWDNAQTIKDSWYQIYKASEDGTYKTKYKIGDTKVANFGEMGLVMMRLSAFDTDIRSDGSGNAHMTWLGMHALKKSREGSSSRYFFADNPEGELLRAAIKMKAPDLSYLAEVNKTCLASNKVTATGPFSIWILSAREVGIKYVGSSYWYRAEDSGVAYSLPSTTIRLTGSTPTSGIAGAKDNGSVNFATRSGISSGDEMCYETFRKWGVNNDQVIPSQTQVGTLSLAYICPCFCI